MDNFLRDKLFLMNDEKQYKVQVDVANRIHLKIYGRQRKFAEKDQHVTLSIIDPTLDDINGHLGTLIITRSELQGMLAQLDKEPYDIEMSDGFKKLPKDERDEFINDAKRSVFRTYTEELDS